ncbi:WecB/TagA/CpsF family glycosyltransferase [Stackebrandtia nassauensis]|uniref:Glycosyl transferase, WecB/TagA/CpsF family n=1 Tax=Stackebrandtia nassauensis (strain DSM 44728 / CIP 108903 / NRRL B-16338 / NBRC 102104 / LLR-40K-21) TaxID=446470 RepID=D3PVD5_STANL|nr:WecB/TagA/CpsF family glycosyltransferase [Stackebrandtia nassauensis]ADD41188.1 glycosyl transferase, WecB/TagA/CpsF family [Stackebrandtia nassauensis DSM 44728]
MDVGGIRFDALTSGEVIDLVGEAWLAGRGGRIVTPNVDIVRQTRRVPEARAHVRGADLVVADGAPLIWASRLSGRPLPERVAGSDLVWSLSQAAAGHGRRVFLLGGDPVRDTAGQAAARLRERYPDLTVAGACSPPMGFDRDEAAMRSLVAELCEAKPDIVFVGLGFPKQERLIARLAPYLPAAWFLGCGAGIDFVAGAKRRAPHWMRRSGLEWLHRLGSEPRRLFVRYVLHDIPAACGLLLRSGATRLRR